MNYQDELEDEHKQANDTGEKSVKPTQRASQAEEFTNQLSKFQAEEWEPEFEMVIQGIHEPQLHKYPQSQPSTKSSTQPSASPNSRPKPTSLTVREVPAPKPTKHYRVAHPQHQWERSYHITPTDLLPIAKPFTLY